MKTRYAVLVVILAAALAHGEPVQGKTADGWKVAKVASFSIALPKDWQVIDLSSKDVAKIMSNLTFPKGSGEQLKATITQLAQQGVFKLYAFGPKVVDGFQENLNVNVLPSGGMSLKQIKESNEKGLASVAKSVNSSMASSPDRVILNSTMQAKSANGAFEYATHGQMFLHNGKVYTFTFSCAPSARKRMEDIAKQAIKTLKIN